MLARLRPWLRWALLVSVAAGAVLVLWILVSINSDSPVLYEDIQEHFKYGSIGSEPGGSLLAPIGGVLPPYWVFRALPSVCADRLPGGYATFGFVTEPGKDLPVGISRRRRFGVDHVGLNCAVCHTSTVRDTPDGAPRIVLGMPAQTLDLQAFVQFVLDCTLDNRLTADAVRGRYPARGGPSLFERVLMRTGLIDRLKLQTLNLRNRMAPILAPSLPRWGRGRVDTFNPYKAIQFNWDLTKLPGSELIGASDFPSIWNQKPRQGMHLHWDGDNDSVDERNLSASLGAGVTPVTVDHPNLKRVRDWIWTLPPPAYPYPIDAARAAQGAPLYATHCAVCHGDHRFRDGVVSGARIGTVVPIADIATDRHRLDSYTLTFAMNQYGLYPDSPYRFTHFRKTNGYANHPLDGIWLRAPYLHNGSVPTLRDLLDAPESRPVTFYRGYDLFDREKVGFVTDVPAANGQLFTPFDTRVPGNGNGGHRYGTALSPDDKRAIVEYMKTF
ncbi:MAG: cytochrome c [Acidobacteria bacterium]|nr:cytochrome c [Acidobacteriota bacterium]